VVVERRDRAQPMYARVVWARKGGAIRRVSGGAWIPACLAGCVVLRKPPRRARWNWRGGKLAMIAMALAGLALAALTVHGVIALLGFFL
jgi:hypothetical protein